MITKTVELPEILIKKGVPFGIYSFPEKNEFQLIFQKNTTLDEISLVDINTVSGFIVADFNSANTGEIIVIKPDFIITDNSNFKEVEHYLSNLEDIDHDSFHRNNIISKEDYLSRAEYLIDLLKKGELEKIVYSRVITKELKEPLNLKKLLETLREKYKDAFINLFHLPNVGTWVGASPETIFRLIDSHYYSDSLAGTRLINDKAEEPKWNNKEMIEQQLVSNYIESVFSELGVKRFEKFGPNTTIAGNLFHIHTTYKVNKKFVQKLEGKIIAGLHPTPAVCGLPKGDAYKLIGKAEQHERRFYTGFIGPWRLHGQSQLFVNLRCAEIGNLALNLYVGGGLTEDSIPKEEYMETIHKSQTLLSVVENL